MPAPTFYQLHVKAKQAGLEAANVLSRVDNVPPLPAETGTGDAYFAGYWLDRANDLIHRTDVKLGQLGYPK